MLILRQAQDSNTAIQQYSNTAIQQYSNTAIQQYSNTAIQQYSNTAIQQYSKYPPTLHCFAIASEVKKASVGKHNHTPAKY